jgi:uncharacterized membrane protein
LSAQLGEVLWFCIAIILILSCKEILGLNVVGLGFWLLVFQKQRTCGAIAIISGMAWFLIDIKLIIPAFVSLDAIGGSTVTVSRYAYAGNSPLEIAKNLLFSPNIVLVKVFSWDNFQYLCLLFLPVIWALSLQHLVPLVGAIPPLALNLLADYEPQKSLAYHYSLTVLPFIIVAIIDTFADKQREQKNYKILILWSVICFFGLARWIYFFTKYLPTIDTWQATREAISYVRTKDGVLASEMIVPHLSQRIEIERLVDKPSLYDLANYKYVLLNKRHPGINSTAKFLNETITQLKEKPEFKLSYERDEVFVFEKLAEQSTKAAS